MSVYKQGERGREEEERRRKEEDKKKKDVFDEIGEGFDKMGANIRNMFTSKEKKWEKKGEGHSLGTAADAAAAAERRHMAPEAAGNQAAAAAASRAQPPRRPPSAGQANAAAAAAARADAASAPKKPQPAAASTTPRSNPSGPLGQHPKFACGGAVGGSTSGGGGGGQPEPDPVLLAQLVEMGFDAASARSALHASGQQLEVALDMLSSGQVPAPTPAAAGATAAPALDAQSALRVVGGTGLPTGGDGLRRAMEAALEQLVLDGGSGAVPLLLKLVSNVASAPDEPKYRKVRLTNPKISAAVCEVSPAAPRLLAYCGFTPVGDGESVGMSDAAAADAPRLTEAVVLLQTWAELPPGALPPPPLGPLDVCVLLNADGSSMGAIHLPDDFYDLSGAEAKALMAAAAQKKAQEGVLKTREQREMDAAKRRRRYRKCLIRVRFPDGVMIQATFGVHAPVSRVLQWLSECLREPGHAFDLSLPRSKPLTEMDATLEQAELAPAALLNFRVTDAEGFDPPYLTPELLAQAQTLSDAAQAYPQGFGGVQPQPAAPVREPTEPRPPPRWMQQ